MRIILTTYSSDENFNGECDYAVVELTPELVAQVRRRVELARQAGLQDQDLWELYFWDGTAEFYDSSLLEACENAVAGAKVGDADQAAHEWQSGLEQDGHAGLPEGVNLAAHQPQRTEADQMVLHCRLYSAKAEFEIAWTASPKHTDVYVTTSELTPSAMEAYLRREEEGTGPPSLARNG